MMRTAVVIAGGRGERLKPLTDDRPKAMVPVGGRPLIGWILDWLREQGIRRVVIGIAWRGDRIVEFVQRGGAPGLEVRFSEHTLEGGTAEGFRLAIERHVDEADFVAMNCDEITNLSLARLEEVHRRHRPLVTMALAPFHCRFSVVDLAEDGRITGFKYGRQLPQVPVSTGIYIFNAALRPRLPERGSIEDLLFAPLAGEGRLAGCMLGPGEEWISVNDAKNIREAEDTLRRWGRLLS
ncbi:MAG: nucleotidyltransferase family protein [Kiritimatiellae bacterium]|nr:nucleotidyltransferase family protein [Kiritimatiellia bacterium]